MKRIEKEIQTIEQMIRLYCRQKEKNNELCPACNELISYARSRLTHCPFGDKKPACKHCKIHCYKPEMREHMRMVMRFSGPRMIFYAPAEVFRHLFHRKLF